MPNQNATTLQVAISVIAAVLWIIENPNKGVLTPEDLPHEYILNIARPYLGNSISAPSDWTPLNNRRDHFNGFGQFNIDTNNPWQFKNFLVTSS